MNSQRVHRLVLHPHSPGFGLDSWDVLIDSLRDAEFLDGEYISDGGMRFLAGERFLQFITFMGCSPSLELTPPADGSLDFCHVRFSRIYDRPQFRRTSQNVFARCPQCRKRIANWEQVISHWLKDATTVTFQCDKCSAEISILDVGWRHTAGFARMFMDIYSIYPQEGIPTDQFLSLMRSVSATSWDYFFTDQ